MKKKILLLIMIFGLGVMLTGCGNNNNDDKKDEEKYLSGKHYVELSVKDIGIIKLELDADIAPITVTNFINLVEDKFYDGLTFHRIIEGFMIQGGAPKGNGTSETPNNIKGEFLLNGVNNSISHTRGVISMARADDYDSASSQFFIVHEDSTFLNGSYAAFGHVTEGIEVVDEIAENTIVEDDGETVLKENQPIIEYIKVIEE